MVMYRGNRATSGDGTAIATAAAGRRLRVNGLLKLQAKAAGPINALVKFGSTVIYSAYFVNDGDGELILPFPLHVSGEAEALYINLDVAKSVDYAIEIDEIRYG